MRPDFLSRQSEAERNLHSFLLELVHSFKLSEEQLSEIIKATLNDTKQVLAGIQSLSAAHLLRLSHTFNFSMEAASRGFVDMEVLADHHQGKVSSLPSRYSIGAFSRKLNAINLFDTIGEIGGAHLKSYTQEYFQAGANIYNDPNGAINVNFFCDVFSLLKKNGISDLSIGLIGNRSVNTAIHSGFGKSLERIHSPQLLFQIYFESFIRDLERNNTYKIVKLDSDHCIVDSLESKEVCDLFGKKHVGSRERCVYRAGALEATTRFIGFSDCKVIETSCAFLGDPHCRFLISYSSVQPLAKKEDHEIFH